MSWWSAVGSVGTAVTPERWSSSFGIYAFLILRKLFNLWASDSSFVSSIQGLSHVWLCDTVDCSRQASLSITNSQSSPELMSMESVMPSNHSSIVIPFSSCPQSFPTSGSFPMGQLFTSGGQSIVASALPSVLPMNIQDWFPLELTDLNSLLSQRLSRLFSNTTVQKHQFFSAQPSVWCNSHIHTWLLGKP